MPLRWLTGAALAWDLRARARAVDFDDLKRQALTPRRAGAVNGWFPSINGRGEIVSGSGEIFFQRQSLGQGWIPKWLDDDRFVYNRGDASVILNVRTGVTIEVQPACNQYAAGGGRWLGLRQSGAIELRLYQDAALLRQWTGNGWPAVSLGGQWAYADGYHAPRRRAFLNDTPITEPLDIVDLSVCETATLITVAPSVHGRETRVRRHALGTWEDCSIAPWQGPQLVDGPNGEPWIFTILQAGAALYPVGSTEGYDYPGREFYYPHVRFLDGRFLIAASSAQGEPVTEFADPTAPRVPLGQVSPPPVEPPPPSPPGDDVMVKAAPRRYWRFAFHTHHLGTPPDLPLEQYPGNAILALAHETDPTMLAKNLQRVSALGQPMIVDAMPSQFGGQLNPNLTVAWWTGFHEEGVQRAAALEPRVPIIAYLDDADPNAWPANRPTWMTDKTWPMAQLYRQRRAVGEPLETMAAMRERCFAIMERITSYGNSVAIVTAWYDRAGRLSEPEIIEQFPLYDEILRTFPVMVDGMFSWQRGHGIKDHPVLIPHAWARFHAIVARPNRYDGWDGNDLKSECLNILMQDIETKQFTAKKKQYLIDLLRGASGPLPPEPPVPPPSGELPMRIDAVKKALRTITHVDPTDEARRGVFIDVACKDLNTPGTDRPWGRKARNADGSNKNTDGLTYLWPDNRFSIVDALNGSDPGPEGNTDRGRFATWEVFGPFSPGENGWWAPHEPV